MGIYKGLQSRLDGMWEFVDIWLVLPAGMVFAALSIYEFFIEHGSVWEIVKEAGYLILAILLLLRVLTRFLKRDVLKGFPTLDVVPDEEAAAVEVTINPLEEYYYMSDSVAELLCNLNSAHFQNTDYDYPKKRIVERNTSLIAKNPRVFMIVNDPLLFNRAPLGYLSIIPINAEAKDIYLCGRLSDADLTGRMVTAPQAEPAALLFFAIAKKQLGSVRADTAAFQYLAAHLSVYLSDLAANHTIAPRLPLIAQSSDKGTTGVLKMMSFTEYCTAEGKTVPTLDGGILFSTTFQQAVARIRFFAHRFITEEKLDFY